MPSGPLLVGSAPNQRQPTGTGISGRMEKDDSGGNNGREKEQTSHKKVARTPQMSSER